MSTREDVIAGLVAKGWSRDKAEAGLELVRSGLARRGFIPGEPLAEADREETARRFLAPTDEADRA